jgi:glycosyltransferase involved in cell wall biosynthesis
MKNNINKSMVWDQNELLSICIPTYNRAPLLAELLEAISREMLRISTPASMIGVYISDNASNDNTQAVIQSAKLSIPHLCYSRNETNIGGDANILHVRTLAQGYYTWVLGDDEILHDGALETIVKILCVRVHGLIVLFDSLYDTHFKRPTKFEDYADFARFCIRTNPHALVEHTLISSNIYRSDCFDFDVARKFKDMYYSHMYGMIRPIFQHRLSVFIPEDPVIGVRVYDRPYSSDGGSHPPVDEAWQTYLSWLRVELKLPEIDIMAPSRIARKMMLMKMLRHPFLFLWRNRGAFSQPSAYRHLFMRVFLPRRALKRAGST